MVVVPVDKPEEREILEAMFRGEHLGVVFMFGGFENQVIHDGIIKARCDISGPVSPFAVLDAIPGSPTPAQFDYVMALAGYTNAADLN